MVQDNTLEAAAKPPRKASRDARRGQLIEATISVLARRGYAETTLTEVAVEAGVSHGMVNFHFRSKQNLLTETLAFLAEEYRENWTAALDAAPPDPASRLDALMRADFAPAITTPDRLSAWCAFWGEAQSKPIYQEKCGANDAAYNEAIERLCAELIAEGDYDWQAARVAQALRCMVEGIWLEMMTAQAAADVDEGLGTTLATLSAFFPRHFAPDGHRLD